MLTAARDMGPSGDSAGASYRVALVTPTRRGLALSLAAKGAGNAQDRDAEGVARGEARAAPGGEGAHAAQRRAGAAAAGAAVGADRQGVPIRYRRGERIAEGP